MNVVTRPSSRTHTIIAAAAVAWNVLGLVLFLMQVTMSAEQVAALAPHVRHDARVADIRTGRSDHAARAHDHRRPAPQVRAARPLVGPVVPTRPG